MIRDIWSAHSGRFDFYVRRDLDEFTCTAGALDTVCVDKETSGALIIGWHTAL